MSTVTVYLVTVDTVTIDTVTVDTVTVDTVTVDTVTGAAVGDAVRARDAREFARLHHLLANLALETFDPPRDAWEEGGGGGGGAKMGTCDTMGWKTSIREKCKNIETWKTARVRMWERMKLGLALGLGLGWGL